MLTKMEVQLLLKSFQKYNLSLNVHSNYFEIFY
jgi:hypothetical protein